MVKLEFSQRALERFQGVSRPVQRSIAAKLDKAKDDPEGVLERNRGYNDYTIKVECPPPEEDHLVILTWHRKPGYNPERLSVLTLGPESKINR